MPGNIPENSKVEYTCYSSVGTSKINCSHCGYICTKYGKTKKGKQRFQCRSWRKTSLSEYDPIPNRQNQNKQIIILLKEGCSIRSISRIVKASATTIVRRIKKIGSCIEPPVIETKQTYEVDELCTFIQSKAYPVWIAYAINKATKQVVAFNTGPRSNQMLSKVTGILMNNEAVVIHTDKLLQYKSLIPPQIHNTRKYSINHIERKNLTLRTHLKRLNRRTICFSRSMDMLRACLMIYFFS